MKGRGLDKRGRERKGRRDLERRDWATAMEVAKQSKVELKRSPGAWSLPLLSQSPKALGQEVPLGQHPWRAPRGTELRVLTVGGPDGLVVLLAVWPGAPFVPAVWLLPLKHTPPFTPGCHLCPGRRQARRVSAKMSCPSTGRGPPRPFSRVPHPKGHCPDHGGHFASPWPPPHHHLFLISFSNPGCLSPLPPIPSSA